MQIAGKRKENIFFQSFNFIIFFYFIFSFFFQKTRMFGYFTGAFLYHLDAGLPFNEKQVCGTFDWLTVQILMNFTDKEVFS